MTDKERGAFNVLFGEDQKEAIKYLEQLQPVLEKRLTANMLFSTSKEEQEDRAYALNMRAIDDELDQIKEGEGNYWEAVAWDKYRDYSDAALKRIIDDSINIISDPSARTSTEAKITAQQDMADAQSVLEKRKQAKDSAKRASYLYGYTDEAGINATRKVKGDIGKYSDSKYAYLVNGFYKPSEAGDSSIYGFGTDSMGLDLYSGIKNWEDDKHWQIIQEMTDEERDRFNYVLVNEGAEAADSFIDSIYAKLDELAKNKVREKQKEDIHNSGLSHVRQAAVDWVAGVIGEDNLYTKARQLDADIKDDVAATIKQMFWLPYEGGMSVLGTLFEKAAGGHVTKTQAATWNVKGGATAGVSQDIADAFENESIGEALNFMYGIMTSSGDSMFGQAISKEVPFLGELALAGSAYASSLADSLDRGLTDDQAIKMATTSALVEFITEHLGMDVVMKGVEAAGKRAAIMGAEKVASGTSTATAEFFKQLGWQAIINFFPEGLEEAVGKAANTAADFILNGDKAEYMEAYNQAIRDGYSHGEASKLAALQFAKDAGMEFLSGGIAGSLDVSVAGAVSHTWNTTLSPKAIQARAYQYSLGEDAMATKGRHLNQFDEGRSIIDNMYGVEAGDRIREILKNNETIKIKNKINSIVKAFDSIDSSNDFYRVLYDEKGNQKLSKAEKVAYASMLAFEDGSEATPESIEEWYIHEQASKQTDEQRDANTNYDWIKTQQELRQAEKERQTNQRTIEKYSDPNSKSRLDKVAAVEQAQARADKAQTLVDIATPDKMPAALEAQEAATRELKTARDALENYDENAKEKVSQAEEQIRAIDLSIDRHYASMSEFLQQGRQKVGFYQAQYDRAKRNREAYGAALDELMSKGELTEEGKKRRDQLQNDRQ